MPQVGYQHFLRAARADLLDVRHNAGDGIHGASAGGLWQAVVFGFGGLRITDDRLGNAADVTSTAGRALAFKVLLSEASWRAWTSRIT